jgi:hypothetical protein
MLKLLATKVGGFLSNKGMMNDFEGKFYRARVRLDVMKPLKNTVANWSCQIQRTARKLSI